MATIIVDQMFNRYVERVSNFCYPKAAWLGLVMIFGLPWSHAFFYIGLVGMLFFLAVSATHYKDLLRECKENVALLALVLFLFIAAGMLYTQASVEHAVFDVKKYRKLLLIPVFLLLYRDMIWARRLVIAYSCGVLILILPTVLDGTGLMNTFSLNMLKYRDGTYTSQSLVYWRNHIVNGFHASILFTICIYSAIRYRRKVAWLCLPVAVICVVDIIFFIHGRMALMSLFAVSLLMALSYITRPLFRVGLLLIALLIPVASYQASEKIKDRIDSVANEARSFVLKENIITSGGIRLHYWDMSVAMFMDAPIVGNGPGSFRTNLDKPENPLHAQQHRHAHNEYLTLLSQHGLVGLFLFLGLTQQIYQKAGAQTDRWLKGIVRAGLVVFLLNAVTDSSLHNESEGWTFVLLACLASVRVDATSRFTTYARN